MQRQRISGHSPYEPVFGFSRAVVAGDRVLVAGTAPVPAGGGSPPPGAYAQAKLCLDLISEVLTRAGTSLEHVVRTRMFITDAAHWPEVARAHGEVFAEQRERYAAELAHAGQLAARFDCGEVAGVFSAQADIGWRNLVPGLLPLAAVPFLIVGAAAGIPGMLPAFGAFLFLFIAWYGLTLWRAMRRRVWFYAFTGGFILLDDPSLNAAPVRWGQVTEVRPVWTEVYSPASEESKTVLTAYRLRTADGQAHEISRSFKDVQDPYLEMGQLFRRLAPNTIGTTMPTFPTIDEIIAAYVRKPGPGA